MTWMSWGVLRRRAAGAAGTGEGAAGDKEGRPTENDGSTGRPAGQPEALSQLATRCPLHLAKPNAATTMAVAQLQKRLI